MWAEISAVIIIMVMIFLRIWQTSLTPLFLPWEYLTMIGLLLFQKQAIFLLKLVVFPPIWLFQIIVYISCVKKCGCKGKKKKRKSNNANNGERGIKRVNSNISAFKVEFERKSKPFKIDQKTNMGMDSLVKARKNEDNNEDDGDYGGNKRSRYEVRFKHRSFYSSSYSCRCCMSLHVFLYPLFQWITLMYHDRNVYIRN